MKRLLSKSDIFVENFKTGTLEKYGLGYHQIKEEFPGLIYCSITGFGHTGPYSARPGYDALIQAMGGIMSITGEPDGAPMKVGLSICDLTAGMHGAIGILAALRHKMVTGEGQHVDIGMLDVTTALLANQGMNYLATGKQPARLGNAHPNIVPYQVMPASDGFFILSVGNDATFERFIAVAQQADPDANAGDLFQDERFNCAVGRVTNREHVTATCNALTKSKPIAWWLENLEKASVGVSPIMDLEQVFADPHVQARGMVMEMEHKSLEQPAKLIASPLKFDKTPVSYRTPPPLLGEHSEEVLTSVGGYTDKEVAELREAGAI
jgi:crotonobetainyl-CoA:carnitine CoA-transferase CaiB-like acyl-CoA transferase